MNFEPSRDHSFTGDPALDNDIEKLIQENEKMLMEIEELRKLLSEREKRIASLEDTLSEKNVTIASLEEMCRSNSTERNDELEDLQEKYRVLMEAHESLLSEHEITKDTLSREVEERERQEHVRVPDQSGAQPRLDRILRELKALMDSQKKTSIAQVSNCKLSTHTPTDQYPSLIATHLTTLQKLIESSRRLLKSESGDDEIIVLVRTLVGELFVSSCQSLCDTMTAVQGLLPSSVAKATKDSAASASAAASVPRALGLDFWKTRT